MTSISPNTDTKMVFDLLALQEQMTKTTTKSKSPGVLLYTSKDGTVQAKAKGTAFGRFFSIVLRRGGRDAHNLKTCIASISKQIEACKSFTKDELGEDTAKKLENLVTNLNDLINNYNNGKKQKKSDTKIANLNLIFKSKEEKKSAPADNAKAPIQPESKKPPEHTWKPGIKNTAPSPSKFTLGKPKKDVQVAEPVDVPVAELVYDFELPDIKVSTRIPLTIAEEKEKTIAIFKSALGDDLFEKISADLGVFKADDSSKDTAAWRKEVPESLINYFKNRTQDRSIPGIMRDRTEDLNKLANTPFTEWSAKLKDFLQKTKEDLTTLRSAISAGTITFDTVEKTP